MISTEPGKGLPPVADGTACVPASVVTVDAGGLERFTGD